ncbi:hypothetical protein ABBQ38_008153 [Trebouxia sp. C0009 RCD-2024]
MAEAVAWHCYRQGRRRADGHQVSMRLAPHTLCGSCRMGHALTQSAMMAVQQEVSCTAQSHAMIAPDRQGNRTRASRTAHSGTHDWQGGMKCRTMVLKAVSHHHV